MRFSPEQYKIVRSILSPSAIASHQLEVEIETVDEFAKNTANFVSQYQARIGLMPYLFILSSENSKNSKINLQKVKALITSGKSIIFVDKELHFIKAMDGDVSSIHKCSEYSEGNFGVRIQGTHLLYYLNGRTAGEENLSGQTITIISNIHYSINELDTLIEEHLKRQINKDTSEFWYDKDKRTLRSKPDSTELIFHRKLFWWLENCVVDMIDIYAEATGFGQPKTDIVVVTASGSYVFELKWLGVNESKTKCDEKGIDPAVLQLKEYLDKKSKYVSGHLIFYDARQLDEHMNKQSYNKAYLHELSEPPRFLFLESETPSKKAKRIAKK